MSEFIVKIKEAREKQGIKQSELADKMKTSQQVISRYELGKTTPSLEKLVELAQILNVSLDELIEYKRVHHQYSNSLSSIKNQK